MNRWAKMLAAAPPSLQRLIARTQRISLPRGCSAEERVQRLRAALCHAATIRATYQWLPAEVQAALQHLRDLRGGISPADLERLYGPLRSWTQLLADPQPQTISERLLLLGWLLPRPAARFNPPRFLLAPELRDWLPQPLRLPSLGAPPASADAATTLLAPAVRAATALLLACAEHPLTVRSNGALNQAALRRITPALVPLTPDGVTGVCTFVWPLLCGLGLVAVYAERATLAPAGERFLRLSLAERRAHLEHAWVAAPQPDAWLTPLLIDTRGIDWPLLRRRLLCWADYLPVQHCFDPASLFTALTAACGPLADAHTHGFRTVDRLPWQPRRAAAIWEAALRGPLTWLGLVAWTSAPEAIQPHLCVYRPHVVTPADQADTESPSGWQYGQAGQIRVPHQAADAALLRLLPFVATQTADATATTYTFTQTSLNRAAGQGWSSSTLWELVESRLGPPPAGWRANLATPGPAIQIATRTVVIADVPAILDRAARGASVRRHLHARLAPGIALVEPANVAPLTRSLERQGLTVALDTPTDAPASASDLSAGERAALLVACAFYRENAPPDALLLPHTQLEQRLRATLPPALRTSTDAVLADLHPTRPVTPQAQPWQPAPQPLPPPPLVVVEEQATPLAVPAPATTPPVADPQPLLHTLRRAIATRQMIQVSYTTEHGDQTQRVLRPLELERRGGYWYLRAYCTVRQAERTFRVDRIEHHDEPVVAESPPQDRSLQSMAA